MPYYKDTNSILIVKDSANLPFLYESCKYFMKKFIMAHEII